MSFNDCSYNNNISVLRVIKRYIINMFFLLGFDIYLVVSYEEVW